MSHPSFEMVPPSCLIANKAICVVPTGMCPNKGRVWLQVKRKSNTCGITGIIFSKSWAFRRHLPSRHWLLNLYSFTLWLSVGFPSGRQSDDLSQHDEPCTGEVVFILGVWSISASGKLLSVHCSTWVIFSGFPTPAHELLFTSKTQGSTAAKRATIEMRKTASTMGD